MSRFAALFMFLIAVASSVSAHDDGQIRVINSTGEVLTRLTIAACGTNSIVAEMRRGSTLDRHQVQFFQVHAGCYIVEGVLTRAGTSMAVRRQVNVSPGMQHDVPLGS